jgi:hypothetical protein
VTNGKKKTKKHSLDQRRILFVRNAQSSDCDLRDIMFEVNKALANARAHVTVRLIKMGYTDKGNLTGVVGANACADEVFAHAPAVMAAVQKLDADVVYMDKTEKWCKPRVPGVALDRYMTAGGLELARREIELMTGEQLPYAPRWIKEDTLSERYEQVTIKRSLYAVPPCERRSSLSNIANVDVEDWWIDATTIRLCFLAISWMKEMTSKEAAESRPEVGSSRKRSLGLVMSCAATLRRRF